MEETVGLPSDVLRIVFSRLDSVDLKNCCLVCRDWLLVGLDDSLWSSLCFRHFGHNANLTMGSFVKLSKCWSMFFRNWKNWFDFRRMFRREVAGSIQIEFLEYRVNGKLKKSSNVAAFGVFGCESQPIQKGTKNINFHFCSINTIIEATFYKRSRRFQKKVSLGRTSYPLFAIKNTVEYVWLDLEPDSGQNNELLGEGEAQVHLKLIITPVQYTANDFEYVASISRGAFHTRHSHAESFYVKERDTKKPYFMKIVNTTSLGPAADTDALPTLDTQLDNYTYTDVAEKVEQVAGNISIKKLVGQDVIRGAADQRGSQFHPNWNIPACPFIVDLFTSFRKGNLHYIVMEWVEGGELFGVLRRTNEGRFSEDVVRFYGAQLHIALTHLHNNGLVYRDLKPENLLLDRKGNLKLSRPTLLPIYHYNEYLSPENLMHSNSILSPNVIFDPKCDWWSFGAILFQMLFGVPPFTHPSVQITNTNILEGRISIPEGRNGKLEISEEGWDLLRKCLHPSLKKRLDGKQVRKHEFFRSITDWTKVEQRELKAPAKPVLRKTKLMRRESCLDGSYSESSTTTSQSSWHFPEEVH